MQLLELFTIILLLIVFVNHLIFAKKYSWKQNILPSTAVLITIVFLIINGFDLQMLLAYILITILFILRIIKFYRKSQQKNKAKLLYKLIKIAGIIIMVILIFVATLLPIVFPTKEWPKPTGKYQVATTSIEWIDESRPETFTPDTGDKRDLMVKVWYPTNSKSSKNISDGQLKYPVLIFSHGFGLSFDEYTLQMNELASHGYVIFSLSHPYESSEVIYPDGRVVNFDTNFIKKMNNTSKKEVDSIYEKYTKEMDPLKKEKLNKEFQEKSDKLGESTIKIWTEDTIFVLDKIEQLSESDEFKTFKGRLDLTKIGVFGHSFGGTVAGKVCLVDECVKAGINMDGSHFGQYSDFKDKMLKQPFMFMYSGEGLLGANLYCNELSLSNLNSGSDLFIKAGMSSYVGFKE